MKTTPSTRKRALLKKSGRRNAVPAAKPGSTSFQVRTPVMLAAMLSLLLTPDELARLKAQFNELKSIRSLAYRRLWLFERACRNPREWRHVTRTTLRPGALECSPKWLRDVGETVLREVDKFIHTRRFYNPQFRSPAFTEEGKRVFRKLIFSRDLFN